MFWITPLDVLGNLPKLSNRNRQYLRFPNNTVILFDAYETRIYMINERLFVIYLLFADCILQYKRH